MSVGEMRAKVLSRDGWECQARDIDPDAGPCRDRWGDEYNPWNHPIFEVDYVRKGAKGKRHELPEDHVTLCHWHHQGSKGGHVWATSHRPEMRAWLDRLEAAA